MTVDNLTDARLRALAGKYLRSDAPEQCGIEWAVLCMPEECQKVFAAHHDALFAQKWPAEYERDMKLHGSIWREMMRFAPCPTDWRMQ